MARLQSSIRPAPLRPEQMTGPLSPAMREALSEAAIGAGLQLYRHAWARNPHGPFAMLGTVEGLARRGLVAIERDADAGCTLAFATRAGMARLQAEQQSERSGDVVAF